MTGWKAERFTFLLTDKATVLIATRRAHSLGTLQPEMERAGAGDVFDGGHMGMDLMPMEHEDRVGGASGSRSKRYTPPPASTPLRPSNHSSTHASRSCGRPLGHSTVTPYPSHAQLDPASVWSPQRQERSHGKIHARREKPEAHTAPWDSV